ncbi:MAG: hypothetical protein P0S94_02630, partial [Simkaniaceae bacterium]|nr:hypothetical protein [Simkaniaceae bacterium]
VNLDRKAGSVVASKFIESFVENDTPWVHLDVAGMTFLKKPKGIHRSHVTGYGVKLLLRYLEKIHVDR